MITSAMLKHAVQKKQKGKFRQLSESALEARLVKFLKTKKAYQFKVVKSSRSGTPDRVLCVRGKFVAIELKKEDGVMSELQKHHEREIKENEGKHFVLKPSNWHEFTVWFDEL